MNASYIISDSDRSEIIDALESTGRHNRLAYSIKSLKSEVIEADKQPDALHIAAVELARQQHARIAELEIENKGWHDCLRQYQLDKEAQDWTEQKYALTCRIAELESDLALSGKQINKLQANERKLIDDILAAQQTAQPTYERVGTLYSHEWPINCGWRFALTGLECLGFAVETPVFRIVEKSA